MRETYNDTVVRQFAVMTIVWGIRGHAGRGGHRRAARVAGAQLRPPLDQLRPPPPPAHQRGDLRVRRLCAVRDLVPRGAAHLPRAPVLPPARRVHLLGLAGGDRARRGHPAAGHHPGQGVRGARMADRRPHRGGVGGLRGGLPRHHRQAPGAPHLRGELVLRRLHPRGGPAARRQQRGHPGGPVEVLLPSTPGCRTRWCSGGTGTTRSASS